MVKQVLILLSWMICPLQLLEAVHHLGSANEGGELLIGAIFNKEQYPLDAIQASLDLLNEQVSLVIGSYPTAASSRFRLVLDRLTTDNSSFRLSKMVCKALQTRGYHVLIGPSDPSLSVHVQSICDAVDVPHFENHPSLDARYKAMLSKSSSTNNYSTNILAVNSATEQRLSINVHPRQEDVNLAFRDLVLFRGWTRVAILYTGLRDGDGSGASAFHLQHLLLQRDVDCLTRRLPKSSDDEESTLETLLELKQKEYTNILFELPHGMSVSKFFQVATKIGLSGEEVHFILVSLDFDGESLDGVTELRKDQSVFNNFNQQPKQPSSRRGRETLQGLGGPKFYWERTEEELELYNEMMKQDEELNNGTKNHLKSFTFYRLLLVDHPSTKSLLSRIQQVRQDRLKWNHFGFSPRTTSSSSPSSADQNFNDTQDDGKLLSLESAVLHDTLLVLAEAVRLLNFDSVLAATNVSCSEERSWDLGSTFFNYINSVETEGITGKIRFDGGRRSTLSLKVMHYSAMTNSITNVGDWTTKNGLTIVDSETLMTVDNNTEVETLIVVTKEERPYVMLRPGQKGNAAYDGFAIDLLKAISDVSGFKFKLYSVPDQIYGVEDHETGEWNGIVRQLLDRRADLAVASMTINYARQTVIDFTKPFMNLGIAILFKSPKDPATELFSFMNPLALEIWMYILFAYILVSITIWIVARFSPYEWASPNPCDETAGLVFQNDFTLPNSFWFAIGTLMQQGSDLNPRAASTRIVGGIWWFFTLIIISSYTANLAAFLTVERMATPIESADDLSDQSVIKYGTLLGGSTMTFFRDSKVERYQKMWRYMESHTNETFVQSYEEGVERVLRGNYAFLAESAMIDYLIQRNCNLTQIGGLLDSKGYGIATPKGSKWRDKISKAILFLQEKGVIQMYYDKWWKSHGRWPRSDDHECGRKGANTERKNLANALGVVNIGGVFVVLLVGLAFAVIVAICEFCWKTSSLNAKASENIVQTSPLRRNSRRFTSFERRRSRKSLCAEIAKTLVPHLICDPVEDAGEIDDSSYPSSTELKRRKSSHFMEPAQHFVDDDESIYHHVPAPVASLHVQFGSK